MCVRVRTHVPGPRLTLWKTTDMIKKSSRKLSDFSQSKVKKRMVKRSVTNWKLGLQKDERRSFIPATVINKTSQLERDTDT